MRRFLFVFFVMAALSAVFCFSASAAIVVAPYQGSGSSSVTYTSSFSVDANAGDQYYFDVNVVRQSDIVYDPSGRNITAQVYNRNTSSSFSVVPLGCSYATATIQVEGTRVWVFFDRPISGTLTVSYQILFTTSWRGGTFNGTPSVDLSTCSCQSTFDVSTSSFIKNGSNWATVQSNSDKLDKVLNLLDDSSYSSGVGGYVTDEPFVFTPEYYNAFEYYTSSSTKLTPQGNRWISPYSTSDILWIRINGSNPPGFIYPSLKAGEVYTFNLYWYYDSIQPVDRYGELPSDRLGFAFNYRGVSDVQVLSGNVNYQEIFSGYYLISLSFSIVSSVNMPLNNLRISFPDTFYNYMHPRFLSGYPVVLWVQRDDTALGSSALNPDQDGLSSDIDDAGHQQSQQESDMWQNINSYKSDISFGLDGWDEASNGLSYVTGVFMTVWNNSPTQPIVLSLMLGIAMLSIGRGVMAAVRVQRNRRDE